MKQARVLTAEFLGTFGLVFFGAGAICADTFVRAPAIPFGAVDLLLVATAHAMVLGVMVSAMGHISGAHFNPAVTIGAAVARKIEPPLAAMYIAVQLVAGILAAALLKYIWPDAVTTAAKLGAPVPAPGLGTGHAVVIELVLTFFLVTVVFATAIDPRGAFGKIAGFGIGFVLFFDILLGGPLTGAAMNPAREFGPALLAGVFDGRAIVIYWLAPIVGGILAALLYEYVLIHQEEDLVREVPPPSEEVA